MIPPKDDLPRRPAPLLTLALVAANLAAFAWQVLGPGLEASAARGGAIPFEILTFEDVEWRAIVPPPLTILTSMFLHGAPAHLVVNMLTLWIFGRGVEEALGGARFLALYAGCGVVAALVQTLAAAAAGDVLVPMVGASGAIAGALAAFLALFPRARVLRLQAGHLIVVWFALQVAAVVLGGVAGVAFMAHIGGFVAGLLLVRLLGRSPGWRARRAGG